MSISARLTYVRAEDLLDEELPTTRERYRGLSVRRQLAGLGLAFVLLPVLTLLLDRTVTSLSIEGEVLLYLLAVVLVAVVGGIFVAVAAALAAAALINWYFVPPLHTFDIARADQGVALGVFLAVAVIVSAAVELAARRARAAQQAAQQAETLSSLAGADLDETETLRSILDRARVTFAMESVVLKARDRETGAWIDVERAGWGSLQALRFDVPIGRDLRLVGRGPGLFAEDQRVLHAFAAAAQTAYEGRRLSAQAREAESLAAADRQRSALLAAVGHDLRTPLAAIKAAATTLRSHDVDWSPNDRDALLATVEGSVDRLDAIVGNLLDASRLEAGALSVQLSPVALDAVVASTVLELGSEGIEVSVPEDLPLVLADAGLLERVLFNLVDNALRHGGGRVEVSATAGAESAKLEVTDHGPGVAPDAREQLFVPFQRLDDSSTDGVGLGLAVAKGLTEAMGGALVADGAHGGGLTMRMRIPLA